MEYLLSTDKNKIALYNNISIYFNMSNITFNKSQLEKNINEFINNTIKYYNNSILQGDIREQLVYYNKMILDNIINSYGLNNSLNNCYEQNNNTIEQNYLINHNNTNDNLNKNFKDNLNDKNDKNIVDNINENLVENNNSINNDDLSQNNDEHKIFKGEIIFDLNKLNWGCEWINNNNKYSIKETPYNKICLSDKLNDIYKTNILTELEGIHKLIKVYQIGSVHLQNNNMKIIFSKKINFEDFKINDQIKFKYLKCVIGDKEPYDIDNNYSDFITYLENNFFIINNIFNEEEKNDFITVEVNNFLNINQILLLKGSCLNQSRIPNINIKYEIKYP